MVGHTRGFVVAFWYIATQDILTNLYAPKTNDGFDSYTGKSYTGQADFGIGFPLPSFGFRLSM